MIGPVLRWAGGPVVRETPRLLLRPFAEADAPALAALRADPETLRFLPGGEAAAATAGPDAARLVGLWSAGWASGPGYAPWAVVLKETGALIGQCGLRWLPWGGGVTEVLWMLGRDHWRRGYATEAARAALAWGFGPLGLARIEAFVAPGNDASLGVVRRLGMVPQGAIEVFGMAALHFALDQPEGG
ncbi:GNAT family N-acetyltransferase [Roseomonas sp. OT10]|uniref:GNAT family N-acetyltransferase n=1 Tax=Roseomonas cutis TaxID=2897332 RepID=UPI001E39B9F8|nr:GNAT family N-acetyltransferase [Roseomonas sp. OT10]UFN49605.1 GNAT family N-acetyltransferase [Roseomonas sp. OT10]